MSMSENIKHINLDDMMSRYGSTGMLMLFNRNDLKEQTGGDFYLSGGMVICLSNIFDGHVTIDGKRHSMKGPTIAILPENHMVSLSDIGGNDSMMHIAVTTDYILNMPSPIDTDIFSYSRYIPVMHITQSKYDDFLSYFNFLYKESREDSIYQEEIIRSILYALILEISGEYEKQYNLKSGAMIRSDDLSDKFFHLLAVYYKENRTVQFYADKLNITSKYLTTAIKKATGRPVLDWLHEAVLIEAKMLLKTTDLTVQQVSDRLNFSSMSSFIQFFKKHTGMTPKKISAIK
ncbi:MAG: helix-turn-helix domain-containing protein [Bacteroidales bacterium]|nr:helix-turn-helix domain-containing protein [Bacteroidales bacterium]